MKRFVITLQKYYSTLYINYNAYYAKLQIVLQKTTDRTTRNYRSYYTKLQIVLHKTTDCTTQNYKSCYKYLNRLYHIKYTYLHTYMQTTKAIGDRACENRDHVSAKNRRFLACLRYHNLIVIYTTTTKSSSLLQNLMGFLLLLTEMG